MDPAAITRAAKSRLAPAMVGKRVDANHEAAKDYANRIARRRKKPEVPGIDPFYSEAVEYCQRTGLYSRNAIERGVKIPRARAGLILEQMKAAGLVPEKGKPAPEPILPEPEPEPAAKPTRAAAPPEEPDDFDPLEGIPEDIRKLADWSLRELVIRFGTAVAFKDWLDATKKIEDIHEKRLKNATTEGSLVARDLIKKGVLDHVEACHMKLLTDAAKTISRRSLNLIKSGGDQITVEHFVRDQIGSYIKPMKAKIARGLKNA